MTYKMKVMVSICLESNEVHRSALNSSGKIVTLYSPGLSNLCKYS